MTNDRLCAGPASEGQGPCRACGFSSVGLTAHDAVLTLRTLPRRWRDVLALDLDHDEPDTVLATRPSPDRWSALEHAGHVRDVIHALDIRVQRVLREDDPVLPGTHVTPPAGANEQGMAVVLAALGVSVDQLVRTIGSTPDSGWSRTGRRGRQAPTALDLVCEAVHEAAHHLILAEATVTEVRSLTSL